MKKIAIHGFGRIGRSALRVALQRGLFTPAIISDVKDLSTLAALFAVDSNYGRWPEAVRTDEHGFMIGGRTIPYFDANELPDWRALEVDLVVDCTALPGSLHIGTNTSGQDIDLGGYEILIDGVFATRAPFTGSLTLSTVPAGPHTITIDEIASNCISQGPTSIDVVISHTALETADYAFVCQHTPKIATASLPG